MTSLVNNIPLIDLSDSDDEDISMPINPIDTSNVPSISYPPSLVASPISIASSSSTASTITPPPGSIRKRNDTSGNSTKRMRLDSLNNTWNSNLGIRFSQPRFKPETNTQQMLDTEIISLDSDNESEPEKSNQPTVAAVALKEHTQAINMTQTTTEDDDLQILDASSVKVGKFKPSSFEIMQRRQPQQQLHSFQNIQPLSQELQQAQQQHLHSTTSDLFNQPAPVPHVTASQSHMEQVVIAQLRQKEHDYNQEIDQLETQRRDLSQSIQRTRTEYQNLTQQLSVQKQRLSQTMSSGNRDMINNQTGIIAQIHKRMSDLQREMNGFTQLVSPIDWRLNVVKRSLGTILASLRQTGQQLFNSRAVSLNESSQSGNQQGYSANVYSEDLDLRSLMDNIKPDEDLIEGMEPTPGELNINLLKHQRMGLTWMKRMEESKSKGGILADDMGLGKTVQTLALMCACKPEDENCKTTLIIAPVSLLQQWAAEIESKTVATYRPKIGIYHGLDKKSMSDFSALQRFDVILTSYGTLSSEWKRHYREPLQEYSDTKAYLPDPKEGGKSYESPFFTTDAKFNRIILDEAQAIKNKAAIASKAVIYLKANYRFCLSGTPMQNNLDELYPIIRFLKIRPYANEMKFRADIVIPLKSNKYDKYDRKNSMKKLQAILSSILLRRTKNSIIDGKPILELPEKLIESDFVKLESEEMAYYQDLESGIQSKAKHLLSQKSFTSGILTLLLRLRQACCHSYLVRIGEIKAQQKELEQNENIKVDWKKMLRMAMDLNDVVKNRVFDLVSNDKDMLACFVCFDVLTLDSSMVLFSECGHLICQNCIEAFFENNFIDEDNSGHQIAKCTECNTSVKETGLIDFVIFKAMYIERLENYQLQSFCRGYYNPNPRNNTVIINDLIKEDNGFTPSAKMEKCIELLNKIFTEYPNEKVIIFSQFVTLFDLFKLVLNQQGIEFLRYDGSMNMDHKNTVIKQFYQRSDIKVLLLSLRSGNVGLTLTCASHVIIMDPFWNPYVEDQAMDRAHRIGQERKVYVHRLLIEGTVESRIMELQEMKKELIESALNEKDMKSVSKLGQRELGFLFGLNGLREEES